MYLRSAIKSPASRRRVDLQDVWRCAFHAVPYGTYDPLPTVADGYTLSNSEFEAFNRLCSLSIKTVRGAVRNEAAKQYAKRIGEGYSPAAIEKAYIDYAEAYRQNNPSPRFASNCQIGSSKAMVSRISPRNL